MKLFLLRHAKSAWRSFENDHDRALSERGLRDAKTLAEHISNSQISFNTILCSTAKRTKETLKIIKENSPYAYKDINYTENLYHASESTMRDIIEETQTDSLLIVSHNPSISGMISYLSGSQVYNFPTCVFACFSLNKKNIDKDVKTEYIIRPKEGKIISLI